MLYGWKENSMLTNCLPACSHLTITVSEIERDIGQKSSFFIPPPLAFGSLRIAPPSLLWKNYGMEKLEWCGYPMVEKFRRYLYSFWCNSRTWNTDRRTDRQTDRHCMPAIAALMHSIARQKALIHTVLDAYSWCTSTQSFAKRNRMFL